MRVIEAGLASKAGQVSQPVRTKQAGAGGPVKANRAVTVNIEKIIEGGFLGLEVKCSHGDQEVRGLNPVHALSDHFFYFLDFEEQLENRKKKS